MDKFPHFGEKYQSELLTIIDWFGNSLDLCIMQLQRIAADFEGWKIPYST